MVFQNIGLFWIIQSNKNLSFDFQKQFPSWILNGPWYNTTICSQSHGWVFEDYFTTFKRDKYNTMCSIETFEKNRNMLTITNLEILIQVILVQDHFHQIQQKKH